MFAGDDAWGMDADFRQPTDRREEARHLRALERITADMERRRLVHLRRCGARRHRDGRPCRVPVPPGGRCRVHGGASTGPNTADGRQRCKDAARRRWEVWRVGVEALRAEGLCGAPIKGGELCRRPVWSKRFRRCVLHRRVRTGPKTGAGRDRIAQAQTRRWAIWQKTRSTTTNADPDGHGASYHR